MPDVTVINDLTSLPFHFEVRSTVMAETRNASEFSHRESMEMLATIGGACAAGTASVVSAGALIASNRIASIPMVSVPLMAAASAGGTKYGTWGACVTKYATTVWVPLWDKPQYSVRMIDESCVVWDVGANRVV
ncbi:hypothetical protein BDR07DRAFT_1424922 [Suillus spraguei]|nr:hypothetical protein BDR07DRAFT_1424922 [Suillus spraguei]